MDGFNFQGFNIPQIRVPEVNMPNVDLPTWHMWADTQFNLIRRYIEEFEESLDPEHEVGVMLTNFGQSVLMQVLEIGYEESVMLVFKGIVNERPATLIQHINQLNFLLTSVKRTKPEEPKRKIGFAAPDE